MCLLFCQYHTVLCTMSLECVLKTEMGKPSSLSFLLKTTFFLLGCFWTCIWTSEILSTSMKMSLIFWWGLEWICRLLRRANSSHLWIWEESLSPFSPLFTSFSVVCHFSGRCPPLWVIFLLGLFLFLHFNCFSPNLLFLYRKTTDLCIFLLHWICLPFY